jgi:hypothetical protein
VKQVLYAHPDRWTVGLDQHLPPEERARLSNALVSVAARLLGDGPAVEESGEYVEDTAEQRDALARWQSRPPDTRSALTAALDAVVCGALWESPVFADGELRVTFHRGFRLVVEGATGVDLGALASEHGLIVRDR